MPVTKKMIGAAVLGAALLVPVAAVPANADPSTARYCGTVNGGFPGVAAGKVTSCGFARNVARAYMRDAYSTTSVWAWSRATGRGYRMFCRPARYSVLCTGGNGARVKLVS
jgi:hypothetical protein